MGETVGPRYWQRRLQEGGRGSSSHSPPAAAPHPGDSPRTQRPRDSDTKVFHKLRLCISEVDIQKVVANTPGAIEPILCALREKVEDRTAHEDPPGADDPGASSAHADGPWVGLTTHTHAGLPSPSAPSGVKTLWSQMARGACKSQDPAGGPWEHADPRVQQLLEEKEQALALLQESVKILQMKVVRLEQLVKLKDQWIGVLLRPRDKPQ
ncbi:sperm flagellar protein 1-like isoform X5 [Equus przewalskii]|uniref:Sperm flagellar protein 1-like isoform X5 n=1 Tax=Equus przewalskii TaxID=9798 RepID=A0ABM4QBF7_EQUPR